MNHQFCRSESYGDGQSPRCLLAQKYANHWISIWPITFATSTPLPGLFSLDKRNEYIYAAASMRVTRFFELSATIRKAVNESDLFLARSAIDAMLGAAFRYEL